MLIRRLEQKDIPEIVKMGRAMHAESSYRVMPFSEAKCRQTIEFIIASENALGLVAEKDGIVGMFGAQATPHYFSDEVMATDFLLYVKPEFRGSSVAVRLVNAYVKWAESRGIRFMFAGVTTEIKESETAVRLYEKFGFRRVGIVLRRDKEV